MARLAYDKVVVIHVARRGKENGSYYRIVTDKVADTLDPEDPMRDLAIRPNYLVDEIFRSRKQVVGYCQDKKWRIVRTIQAVE